MNDVNCKGTIYYGTHKNNIEVLDSIGITEPFVRNEKFISVSISGYLGKLQVSCHEDISFLASIFVNKYNAAKINDSGFLKWKKGYKNSITFIDGFGSTNSKTYNVFGDDMINDKYGQNITAVIDKKFKDDIIKREKLADDKFQYLSSSLHPFINKITPDMIIGWIVDKSNFKEISEKMKSGIISHRKLYLIENLN